MSAVRGAVSLTVPMQSGPAVQKIMEHGTVHV